MIDQLTCSIRLASDGLDYPLAVDGAASWFGNKATLAVPLPDIPAGHIVAASFASDSCAEPFSFVLQSGKERFETARFGANVQGRERQEGKGAAVPVDYFRTLRELAGPTLTLVCRAPAPRRYLVVVSVRPHQIEPPQDLPGNVRAVAAPCHSQLSLQEDIALRACSPTATAMALGIAESAGVQAFVASARHRSTDLYGAWPQNVWAAARLGTLGGIELISDWRNVVAVLSSGRPLVASIRFATGELAGSPRAQTGGHLVLLRGIDGGEVVVNDPAAEPGSVERRYDARQFATVWMRQRGVAYVFCHQPNPDSSA